MQQLIWLLSSALVVGVAGWGVSDRLEQRNDFCVSCHLPDGARLHAETRENFDRVIPLNLAGVHGRGRAELRLLSRGARGGRRRLRLLHGPPARHRPLPRMSRRWRWRRAPLAGR
jgi:hypothetical protein